MHEIKLHGICVGINNLTRESPMVYVYMSVEFMEKVVFHIEVLPIQ